LSAEALFNPAGGLRYHLRAYRHSARLWQPFRWTLGEWLLGWRPPETTLALFGPSGGYCLQPFLLERFERVICFEPDPLAYAIFRRRIDRAPLDRRPVLERVAEDHLLLHPGRLRPRLETLGGAALLFSNLLGQVPTLLAGAQAAPEQHERVREAVRDAIRDRSFASFHDRVSGVVRPEFEQPLSADGRLTDRELFGVVYHAADDDDADSLGLLDHQSAGYFSEALPHAYFKWELEPGLFHLIEAVCLARAEEPESRPGI
jgi:hypothetical protein